MKETIDHKIPRINKKSLLIFAFLEGSLVIFSELIGAKMLGSFYGTSIEVWTGVITTTISFLTIGYYIGGKLSSKENKVSILKNCFALASLFVIIMPIWSEYLFIKFSSNSLFSDAILSTIFLIGPTVMLLGVSSPVIIQLISEINNETGKNAGYVYAISTLAAIISTLLLGYVLLPYFGLNTPLFIASIILLLLSLYIKPSFLNIFCLIIVLSLGLKDSFTTKDDPKYFTTLYKTEGLMGQLKVMDQTYTGYGVSYRILFINGIPQTIILKNKSLGSSFWEYVHRISATASLKKGKKALLIGMGGGSIAKELQLQKFQLDIVDIDKRMLEISKKYFKYKPFNTSTFTVDDARHYIKTCKNKYDLIVLDICSGEVQPSNVFTLEGINELKNIISNDGIILVQYQEKFNKNKISGSQSIAKTFLANKFKVYQNIENIEIASVVLACSPNEINFTKLDSSKFTENVLSQKWLPEFIKSPFEPILIPSENSMLLEDDKPVLEKINAETIELWRKSVIKNYTLKQLN